MDLSSDAVWLALSVMGMGALAASMIRAMRFNRSKRESDIDTVKRVMQTDRVISIPDAEQGRRGSSEPRRLLVYTAGLAAADNLMVDPYLAPWFKEGTAPGTDCPTSDQFRRIA